jgi:Domain of unknown function (DUF4834)
MIHFFNFLLVFGIVYIILRFILRYVLPLLLGHYINRKMSEMGGKGHASNGKTNRREGDVTINNSEANNKKHYSKDKGEYIDFEEIK